MVLLRKKSIFKKEDTFLSKRKTYLKSSSGEYCFKTISKEKLKRIKKQIVSQQKSVDKKWSFLFILFLITTLSVLFFINYSLNEYQKKQQKIIKEEYISKNSEHFHYLLLSGDEWLLQKKYHNAIFQYKLALKIFPKNKIAHKKLLNAYISRCAIENKDCGKIND